MKSAKLAKTALTIKCRWAHICFWERRVWQLKNIKQPIVWFDKFFSQQLPTNKNMYQAYVLACT